MKNKIGNNIEHAISLLKQGEAVAIPTETVYGLAANVFDTTAVAKIFELKKRPFFDPLIVHTNSIEKAKVFVKHFPDKALQLANAFWPGPLTLLLQKQDNIPDLVTSGLETVGVRIPNHRLTLELLSKIDFPLAAPSANPFGYVSPTTAQHVADQLGNDIHYILDGGVCNVGIESTIVGFENDKPIVYRLGGLSIEDIEGVIGKVEIQINSSSNPKSPGMLKSHYAPLKPLMQGNVEELIKKHSDKRAGMISFEKIYNYPLAQQIQLSKTGDLREAAANLFAAIRTLDQADVDIILAEIFPAKDLGLAINDRLKRASA